MESLIVALGDEVQDVDEETFQIFSQNQSSSQDLGMVDPKADEVEVTILDRDFTVKQSPGVLQSKRDGGTTGATLWRACVLVAQWLALPDNVLFKPGMLGLDSTVLELGSGISGLVPLVLSQKIGRVVATDQHYALKLLHENISVNSPQIRPRSSKTNSTKQQLPKDNIDILDLDWETTDIPSFLRSNGLSDGVDAVLVCDCIFNYALIKPLVQTCAEICKATTKPRSKPDAAAESRPTVCVIVQQLRQPDVFEQWLQTFMTEFRVWRVPDELLIESLKEGRGYVVHIGIAREDEC